MSDHLAGELVSRELSEQLHCVRSSLVWHRIPGDGHCQFRAVASQSSDYGYSKHWQLRLAVARHVEYNKQTYVQFFVGNAESALQDWLRAIRKRAWGDNISLHAMSEILQQPIATWRYGSSQRPTVIIPFSYDTNNPATPVYLELKDEHAKLAHFSELRLERHGSNLPPPEICHEAPAETSNTASGSNDDAKDAKLKKRRKALEVSVPSGNTASASEYDANDVSGTVEKQTNAFGASADFSNTASGSKGDANDVSGTLKTRKRPFEALAGSSNTGSGSKENANKIGATLQERQEALKLAAKLRMQALRRKQGPEVQAKEKSVGVLRKQALRRDQGPEVHAKEKASLKLRMQALRRKQDPEEQAKEKTDLKLRMQALRRKQDPEGKIQKNRI